MGMLASLLTLFAISATAADFRALDIGQSCTSAREWEIAHGSTPIPWSTLPGAEMSAFKGQQFDREVVVMYFCAHGNLFTGNYFFPIESLDQAVDSYRKIHESFLSSYGDTFVDNSPWNGDGDRRSIATDSRKYMTNWRTSRVSATLSLRPNLPSENPGMRVFLVIHAAPK